MQAKFLLLLIFISGIAQKQMFSQSDFQPVLSRALFVPHGASPGPAATLEDAFPAGLAIRPNHVQYHPTPQLRYRKEAGIFVATKQSIVLYDEAGKAITHWDLNPELETLIDFATHPDGLYALWLPKRGEFHLSSFGTKGNQIADSSISSSDCGIPTHVLVSPMGMFIQMLKIEKLEGKVALGLGNTLNLNGDCDKSYSLGNVHTEAFYIDESTFAGLTYVYSTGTYGAAKVKLGDEPGSQEIQAADWQRSNGLLIGIDGAGMFVLCGLKSLMGADKLLRVDLQGNLLASLPMSGIVCSENGSQIALYAWEAGGLRLHYFGEGSKPSAHYPIEQALMERLQNARCAGEIDAKGVVALHFGDEMGSYGTTLHLHEGKVEALHLDQPFLSSHLGVPLSWQVTREGKVLVPISTPAGIVVVSILF